MLRQLSKVRLIHPNCSGDPKLDVESSRSDRLIGKLPQSNRSIRISRVSPKLIRVDRGFTIHYTQLWMV